MNEYGIFDNFMFRLDMISFAEYRKPDPESPYVEDNEGGTYVHLFPEARCAPVRISKKNVLKRFHTWLEECIQKNGISREISFETNWPQQNQPQVILPDFAKKEYVVNPVYCKQVTSDGKEHWSKLPKGLSGGIPVNNTSNQFIR